MTPAHATILQCPHCGGKKEVFQFASGNTFGATQWSDCKQIAPMLPRVSFVQRCPQCGHYYFYTQEVVCGESNDYSGNLGDLPYEYLKEALKELQPTGENEFTLRLMLVWAFNDRYGTKERTEIPTDEWNYFEVNVRNLLLLVQEDLLKAELHREIGEYTEAMKILESLKVSMELLPVQEMFKEHTRRQDRKLFVIYGDGKRKIITLKNYKNQ